VRGLANTSNLESFATAAAATYADSRGWNLGGSIGFRRVSSGGDFTLWLAAARTVPGFGPPCDSTYSCTSGRNVIINETRWLTGSPSWNATGASLADYLLGTGSTFINDVIITGHTAYFTDSSQPTLYAVPLGPHGQLPPQGAVRTIALAGDFQEVSGFNANGIVATPDGQLVIVNSTTGKLYKVDPATGFAKEIAGVTVVDGDGLLLQGHRLYVIENFTSTTAIVELSHDFLSGKLVENITSPDFDVTATAAKLGDDLYITNARFEVTPTPTTPYWLTRLSLHP
jgi:sugar lactone lactonase YvrE